MNPLRSHLQQTIHWARSLISKRRSAFDLRGADADSLQIVALQSGDPARMRGVLDPRNRLSPAVAPHVIPLLAFDGLAHTAVRALQPVAEQHAGKLLDALLDGRQPVAMRRRIPRVLSTCNSQRVVDGLLLGLRDERREVREQCARALLLIHGRHPELRIDDVLVFHEVHQESSERTPDLGIVFTLLALVLPRQPIRSAYRALRKGDLHLRGTALEYLHGVLPAEIRQALWPHVLNTRTTETRFVP